MLEVDERQLAEVERALLGEVLAAGSASIGAATRRLEKDLEAQTRAAARGRAWRAWKSEVYPRGGRPAYDPVGEVFANGGRRSIGMLVYWSLPGTNRAKNGRYLAVPLKAALGTFEGRHVTPEQWERSFGAKLRPLFRPGKTPLLVADGEAMAGGRFVPANKAAAKRRGGQSFGTRGTVAVFALIEEQAQANRVSIGTAKRAAERYLADTFRRRLARIGS